MKRKFKGKDTAAIEKKLEEAYAQLDKLSQEVSEGGVNASDTASNVKNTLDEVAAALVGTSHDKGAKEDAQDDVDSEVEAVDEVVDEVTDDEIDTTDEIVDDEEDIDEKIIDEANEDEEVVDEITDDELDQTINDELDETIDEPIIDDEDDELDETIVKDMDDTTEEDIVVEEDVEDIDVIDNEVEETVEEEVDKGVVPQKVKRKKKAGAFKKNEHDVADEFVDTKENVDDIEADVDSTINRKKKKKGAHAAKGAAAGTAAATAPLFEPEMGATESTDGGEDAGTINAYAAIREKNQKKRRGRVAKGAAAALLAAGLLGGGGYMLTQNQPAAEVATSSAETDVVTFGNYQTSITASGATRPASSGEVTPEVDGIITEVNVTEGDYVQKGDVLFVLKNEALDTAITEAQEAVTEAQNNVTKATEAANKAEADVVNATSDYNRADASFQNLLNTTFDSQEEADAAGSAAEEARAQAIANLDTASEAATAARNELDTANKALTKAEEARKEAQSQADKRIVTAPRDGTIITCSAKTGAAVGGATGGSERAATGSLVTIGDLSQMRVSVQVNEVDINQIATGQKATVSFAALNDLTLPATVEHIAATSTGSEGDNMIDAGGIVTYDVDLVIPEPDNRVKPGMTARVEIITNDIPDVMMVPTSALAGKADGTYAIYVVNQDDNTTIERTVTVKAKDNAMAAIEGNVKEGDVIQLVSADMYDSTEGTEDESSISFSADVK